MVERTTPKEPIEIAWDEYVASMEGRLHGQTDAFKFAWKAALAQPVQEPLAWEQFYPDIGKPQIALNAEVVGYVAPQRPWVGLTDGEAGECHSPNYVQTVARIEAKLKEKNG